MSGSAGRSLGVVPTSPLSRPLGQSPKCAKQAALKRSVALTKQERQQRGRGPIHTGRTWQTVRLSGAHFR